MEIEIRVGLCGHGGELLALLDRPGWRSINVRRRGEIVEEVVCVSDDHEAWQPRLDAYLETPEGKARDEDLQRRIELAEGLVERAVSRAQRGRASAAASPIWLGRLVRLDAATARRYRGFSNPPCSSYGANSVRSPPFV